MNAPQFWEVVVVYISIFLRPLEFLGMIWYIKTKKSGGGKYMDMFDSLLEESRFVRKKRAEGKIE
jgi:hypothetical protein